MSHDHDSHHDHDHGHGHDNSHRLPDGADRPGHDSRPDALPDWVAAAGAVVDWQRSVIAPRADLAVLPEVFEPLHLNARPGVLGYVANVDDTRVFVAATRMVAGEVIDDAVREQLRRAVDVDAPFAATLTSAIDNAQMYLGVIFDSEPQQNDVRVRLIAAIAEALDAVVMDGQGRLVA